MDLDRGGRLGRRTGGRCRGLAQAVRRRGRVGREDGELVVAGVLHDQLHHGVELDVEMRVDARHRRAQRLVQLDELLLHAHQVVVQLDHVAHPLLELQVKVVELHDNGLLEEARGVVLAPGEAVELEAGEAAALEAHLVLLALVLALLLHQLVVYALRGRAVGVDLTFPDLRELKPK